MRRTVVPLLLVLLPLAGCLDSGPVGDHAHGFTAAEARDIAASAALLWDVDATLVFVYGFETTNPNGTEGAAPEEVLGDGRAVAWSLVFDAPGKERSYNVTVGGDGRILSEREEDFDADDTLRDWVVDSDGAVEVLRAEVDGFAARVDDGTTRRIDYFLVNDTDEFQGPVWGLLEFVPDNLFFHVVDAVNGSLLFSLDFREFSGIFVPAEFGSETVALDLLSPSQTYTFSLGTDHSELGVVLTSGAGNVGTVRYNLTTPDGRSETGSTSVGVQGGTLADMEFEFAAEGTYTLALDLEAGARAEVQVDWCTSGEFFPFGFGGFGEHPCDRVHG